LPGDRIAGLVAIVTYQRPEALAGRPIGVTRQIEEVRDALGRGAEHHRDHRRDTGVGSDPEIGRTRADKRGADMVIVAPEHLAGPGDRPATYARGRKTQAFHLPAVGLLEKIETGAGEHRIIGACHDAS